MKWFADFETVTANTEYFRTHQDTKVLVAGLMNENNTVYKVFSNIQQFIDFVCINLKTSDIIYFHNLSWDADFIYKYLFKNNWRPVNSQYEVSHKTIYMFRDRTKIYEIVLGWKNKRIQFNCSYLMLNASVDDIARDLGMPVKDEFINANPNFYDIEPQETWAKYPKAFLDYLKNDINVTRVAVLNFQSALKEKFEEFAKLHDINKFLTTGAMSLKMQEHACDNYGIDPKKVMYCTPDEYDFYKKWFFGGLTQFNPTLQGQVITPQDGKIIDINSAYPYAMTKPLPVDTLWDLNEVKPTPDQQVYFYYHLKIKRATAKYLQCPFLRNWNATSTNNNRYELLLEDFECYYLEQEFDILTKFYNFEGIEVLGVYWCEVKPFLQDYINVLYDLKSHFKKIGNKSAGYTYKILLNCGYGKYAQKYDKKSEFWVPTKDKAKILQNKTAFLSRMGLDKWKNIKNRTDEYYVYELTKLTAVDNICGMSNIAVMRKDIKKCNNMLIASTITALNRVFILDTIYKLGPENFIYCDTDSIFFDAKNADLSKVEIDEYKLGAWDYESDMKSIAILGAKAYFAQGKSKTKIKFSGMNKKFVAANAIIDWFLSDNENKTIENATLKRKQTPSGIVLVVDDYEIKERKH